MGSKYKYYATHSYSYPLMSSSASWRQHPRVAGAAVAITGLIVLLVEFNSSGTRMTSSSSWKKSPYPRAELRGTKTMDLWYDEHEDQIKHSRILEAEGDATLVFLGDSITQGWRHGAFSTRDPTLNGKAKPKEAKLFEERFSRKEFSQSLPHIWAIGGDKVGDLAWRLTHGLGTVPVNPKVFVLMIGTNDIKDPTAARAKDVANAVLKSVVNRLKSIWPRADVLLLGLLPRAPREFPITSESEAWDETNPYYGPIKEINERLEKAVEHDPVVTFVDCGQGFLSSDGSRLPRETMSDYLHPSLEGYRVLADCIEPVVLQVVSTKRHA